MVGNGEWQVMGGDDEGFENGTEESAHVLPL